MAMLRALTTSADVGTIHGNGNGHRAGALAGVARGRLHRVGQVDGRVPGFYLITT